MTPEFFLETCALAGIFKGSSQSAQQSTTSNTNVTVSPILTVAQGITEKLPAADGPKTTVTDLLQLAAAQEPAPTRFAQPADMEPNTTTRVLVLAGLGLVAFKFRKGSA